MDNNEHLVEIQNLSTEFPGRGRGSEPVLAVDDVSFSLPADKAVLLTVVGESGSGKTTLTRNLLGLTRPTGGRVLYKGKDIYALSRDDYRQYRREVQPVFQDPYATYNPFYRIDRVLELPIRKLKLAKSQQEAQDKIEEALIAVDLRPGDVLGRYPHQLSGGERQRIMLARIFLIRPQLIIADEPVSMIDASLRTLFLNILLDFRDKHGISTIHITHNLATAYYLGGQIMIMCKGRVIERGDMDTIIAQPAHPYTQMLIASVPSPDPDQRWTREQELTGVMETAELQVNEHACVFTSRCPHVMDSCHRQRPEFIHVQAEQESACLLHEPNLVR